MRSRQGARGAVLVGGGAFLVSGLSLLIYIATGWSMSLVLAALVIVAVLAVGLLVWPAPAARRHWVDRVRVGVPAGLVATVAYDVSRWLLVEVGGYTISPFKAFPLFGEALLGAGADGGARTVAGVAFHLLNGMAFGTAYAVWFGTRPWWWGIGFGLGLEAFMLAIYPGWLDLRSLQEFTQMSVLGHVVYGAVLGLVTTHLLRRLSGRAAAGPSRSPDPDTGPPQRTEPVER